MQTILLAAAAASAFNLQCDITAYVMPFGKQLSLEDKSEFKVTYRIDLAQKRWCLSGCPDTQKIEAIFERHIVLEQTDSDIEQSITSINRESGYIEQKSTLKGLSKYFGSGKCVKRPFTGFPALKF